VVGTPFYLAPEVLGGDGEDERSDLWSLGVTLYELATGLRPVSGADYQALFGAIRKGRFRPVRELAPAVPRRLARAIERCLEHRPERRFETAAMLAAELAAVSDRLLGGVPAPKRLAALLEQREAAAAAAPGTIEVDTGDLVPFSTDEVAAVRHPWRRPLLWGALAAALAAWAWVSRPW
jgi:serine/threonine-protein kinase